MKFKFPAIFLKIIQSFVPSHHTLMSYYFPLKIFAFSTFHLYHVHEILISIFLLVFPLFLSTHSQEGKITTNSAILEKHLKLITLLMHKQTFCDEIFDGLAVGGSDLKSESDKRQVISVSNFSNGVWSGKIDSLKIYSKINIS